MLISDSKKLLFVHIQKTAGTSVTRYFQEKIPDLTSLLRPHDPLRYAEPVLGANLFAMTKVAFVRNPFDRLVSWYSMIREHGVVLTPQERSLNPDYNRIWQYVLTHSSNFEGFILHCADAMDRSGWRPFLYNQLDYMKTEDGTLAVDFIGRFESLALDVQRLCALLNMPYSQLPHVNRSHHADYRQYYNALTRKVVEERFAEDLEVLGYAY